MALFVIGLNHTTAPLALRERIAFAPSELNQRCLSCKTA